MWWAKSEKLRTFNLSPVPLTRHHAPRMNIGAYLNGLGILAGALFGFTARQPLSAHTQNFFKGVLGALTVFFGLRLIIENLHGNFLSALKQMLLGILAITLGHLIGKVLRLQKISNRMGHHAATLLAAAQKNPPGKSADGLLATTVLFCAAPLGILGAVADGLSNFFWIFLVKAAMDGLAMTSFARIYRWPIAVTALPVTLFLSGLTLALRLWVLPWLDAQHLVAPVNIATGLITCAVAAVVFEIRRVELNSYLPGLVIAPLLGWLWPT